MSPGPPIWAILTFRLGSACAIFSTMLSGGGIGPKSLLPAFAFQVPLKSVLAWAWTSPRARAKRAKENSLNVELRTKTLLLFLEHHLHVGFAHGAGDVLRPGQSLSIGGKGPAVFGSKIVPAEGTLGVDHQLVAVPFQRAFELVVGHVIHAFFAVRGVADVVSHVALHTSGGGMGPKSLLPVFNFQVPLKSVLAWAWTSPRAKVKSANEKSLVVCLIVKLRMKPPFGDGSR